MAFFVKNMISNQVKNLGFGGGSEEKKEEGGTSDPAAAKGMTREEYEEYQKQMIEENDGERCCIYPEKGREGMPSSPPQGQIQASKGLGRDGSAMTLIGDELTELECQTAKEDGGMRVKWTRHKIQLAGDDVDLPEDLRKMVDEDQDEEEEKDSILGQLQNLQNTWTWIPLKKRRKPPSQKSSSQQNRSVL
ncbi:Complexin-4 [Apodemus speciosus]|uniref:Complexin-4 n=1 Tax=Apodemus speciosus TaxID=105296 RepID=A0ABQ0FRG2_APOSI